MKVKYRKLKMFVLYSCIIGLGYLIFAIQKYRSENEQKDETDEYFASEDSLGYLETSTVTDSFRLKRIQSVKQMTDSLFKGFSKLKDSLSGEIRYFDSTTIFPPTQSGIIVYALQNEDQIWLRVKVTLMDSSDFNLIGWSLISGANQIDVFPLEPIYKNKVDNTYHEWCDLKGEGKAESMVIALVSNPENRLKFLSQKQSREFIIPDSQRNAIIRVYNAYSKALACILKL